MRFLSLNLARYGAFTDRRMIFRPDARLHLIYGPNEAGKSTALAAIADLLYGFGKSTVYDFQHKSADLMIAAEIAGADGASLAFQRRKKNKAALTAPNGTPLDDNALSPFLGGLSRQSKNANSRADKSLRSPVRPSVRDRVHRPSHRHARRFDASAN